MIPPSVFLLESFRFFPFNHNHTCQNKQYHGRHQKHSVFRGFHSSCEIAAAEGAEVLPICAELEAEIASLSKEEKAMFISLQNKRISIRAVENLVKKFAQIASPLKKISPHKLRSTFGTNLYKETRDIYIVADVLGHKDVNTTKKHYAAISEDMRKSVADKVKLNSEN